MQKIFLKYSFDLGFDNRRQLCIIAINLWKMLLSFIKALLCILLVSVIGYIKQRYFNITLRGQLKMENVPTGYFLLLQICTYVYLCYTNSLEILF